LGQVRAYLYLRVSTTAGNLSFKITKKEPYLSKYPSRAKRGRSLEILYMDLFNNA